MRRALAAIITVLVLAEAVGATPAVDLRGDPPERSLFLNVRENCGAGFHRARGRCHRNAVRPAVRWVRPRHYHWHPGAAVAAGAAIGFVTASVAVWAGRPPGPNLCWYYTDPSRKKGFWDTCP